MAALHPSIITRHGDIAGASAGTTGPEAAHDAACRESAVSGSVRQRLTGLLDLFAAFPDGFMEAGRGEQEQAERL